MHLSLIHIYTGFPWLLAEEDGAVLGYAYAGRFAARRGYDWDAEVTVYLSCLLYTSASNLTL